MKKILISLLALFMIFTLSACDSKKVEENPSNEPSQNENIEVNNNEQE